jgi:hypothetical protein
VVCSGLVFLSLYLPTHWRGKKAVGGLIFDLLPKLNI